SSNSKILVIISVSISLKTPFSWPLSTIERISSRDKDSSTFSSAIPNILKINLVDHDNILINGLAILLITKIGLAQNIEYDSAFCKAILLGTNSPKIKVINEIKIVINTTAIVSAYGTLQFFNTSAKLLEIPVAALAELKKPAKVIAT